MADGRVLPYLDIPFQHASARILKLMKRPAASANTLERIAEWRRGAPDITLRSTFIVGFPGETEQDFQELLDWLRAAQLDRVGCFEYSPVEGAAANALRQPPVPPEVKAERRARFMELSAEISAARLAQKGRPEDAGADRPHGRAIPPSPAPGAMPRKSTEPSEFKAPRAWPWAPWPTSRSRPPAPMIWRRD